MASKSIFACIILLILLCLLLMREPSSDCSSVHGCSGGNAAGFKETGNRKVLAALRAKKAALPGHGGSLSSKYVENSASSELRKVPSGPDPLHHNGGSPHKPKTP
ncbi:protein CLAVATA 3 [Prosopis cineraria]|uniref:protein CLAVATA 3 n=1 Tax=Prosopis cineraria TaxID=364024 RepID=UPI00240ED0F6|nr:protein CLAVATA 3 [Prosopis cineraria]